MSEGFDGYRKWLGIPSEDQPPHYYRLLGIAVFEDDPDVIENAANRQMTHIRTFQAGRHAELSQKILNELSSARICLLNADKKAAYDAGLQEQRQQDQAEEAAEAAVAPPTASPPRSSGPPPQAIAPPPAPSIPPAAGGPLAAPPLATAVAVGVAVAPLAKAVPLGSPRPQVSARSPAPARSTGFPTERSPSAASKRSHARRKSSPWPLLFGILAVLLLVGLIAAVLNMSQQDKVKEPVVGSGGRPTGDLRPGNAARPTTKQAEPPRFQRLNPNPAEEFTPFEPVTPAGDEPERPRPKPSSERSFSELIQDALNSLAMRQREAAVKALVRAADARMGDEQEAEFEHAQKILQYLDDVTKEVFRGLQRAKEQPKDGDPPKEEMNSFVFEDRRVQLLSYENENLVFQFGDLKIETNARELKPRHAVAFASHAPAFDVKTPEAKIRIAAFLGIDGNSTPDDKSRAVRLLREAAEQGVVDEHLAWLLKIPLGELPKGRVEGGDSDPLNPDRPNREPGKPDMAKTEDDDPFGVNQPGVEGGGSKSENPPGKATERNKPNKESRPEAAEVALPTDLPAASVDAARERLKADFSTKISAAQVQPTARPGLIAAFLEGANADGIEPADKFARLEAARDWASKIGDAGSVCQAIEVLAVVFKIDELEQKRVFLKKCLGAPSADPNHIMTHATAAKNFARSEGRYDLAVAFSDLIAQLAKKLGNSQIARQANDERVQFEAAIELQPAADAARRLLSVDPSNAEANLTLGRYLCFVRADWPIGLPCLAKSGAGSLAAAAQADLARGTDSAADSLAAARQWLEVAGTEKGPPRIAILHRAAALLDDALTRGTPAEKEAAAGLKSEIEKLRNAR